MKSKSILTFLLGAAAGSLTVWLFTSKKGKEIRSDIKEEFEKLIKVIDKTTGS